jgi:hypothetical protein
MGPTIFYNISVWLAYYAASERPRVYRQNLKKYWTPEESRNRKFAFQALLSAY